MSSRASASRKHLPGNALSVCLGCAPPISEPWPQVGWHSPAYALLRVVEQDADDVEQAGEQLQREIEEANPQTCSGGGTVWARQRPMAWPHGTAPQHSRCREGADTEEHGMGRAPSLGCGQRAGGAPSKSSPSALPPQPVDRVITQSASEEFITFSLKTSPWAPCCATLQHFNKPAGCREERKMWAYELTSGLPPDS